MKTISGHMMECEEWGWGVHVDMKLHKSTYERNTRRTRVVSVCMGTEWGMRWGLVRVRRPLTPNRRRNFRDNQLTGTLPPEWSALTSLIHL